MLFSIGSKHYFYKESSPTDRKKCLYLNVFFIESPEKMKSFVDKEHK